MTSLKERLRNRRILEIAQECERRVLEARGDDVAHRMFQSHCTWGIRVINHYRRSHYLLGESAFAAFLGQTAARLPSMASAAHYFYGHEVRRSPTMPEWDIIFVDNDGKSHNAEDAIPF